MTGLQKRLKRIYISFWLIAVCIYVVAFEKVLLYDPSYKVNVHTSVPAQDLMINGLWFVGLIVLAGTLVIGGIILYVYAGIIKAQEIPPKNEEITETPPV